MTEEKKQQLYKDFPSLYKPVLKEWHPDRPVSPVPLGIGCGDGWFEPIYQLSICLEALILQLPEEKRPRYYVVQIKEKFGGLRYYLNASTEEMEKAIRECERVCYRTCEECGATGVLREGPWLRIACDAHSRGKQPYPYNDFDTI